MDSNDSTRATPQRSRFYEGVIVGTAADETDTLMIKFPDRFGEDVFGDPDGVVWTPRPGSVYPADGDWCVAAETDQGTWIVLAWIAS